MNTLLNLKVTGLVSPWFAAALDATLKATVLLLVAALLAVLLRRASAAVRHLVWLAALTGAPIVPVLSVALPGWSLPVLPATEAPARAESSATQTALHDRPEAGFPPWRPEPSMPSPQMIDPAAARGGSPALVASAPPVARARSAELPAVRPTWTRLLLTLWLVGCLVVLIPLLIGLVRVRQIARRARPLTGVPWTPLLDDLKTRLGLSRRVRLLRDDHPTMPMTWGGWRPCVLLPAGADTWPADLRRVVLLHELAHVKRLDCLTQRLAQLACALYWFHPLAWLAAYRMRIERERACDDLVLLAGSKASAYAEHLLEMARGLRPARGTSQAALAMARPSQLEGRLRAILDASRSRGGLSRWRVTRALMALVVAVPLLATVQLGARSLNDPTPAETTPAQPDGVSEAQRTVTGHVLDSDGQPVAEARAAVMAFPYRLKSGGDYSSQPHQILGVATSDHAGRFRLTVPRTSSARYYSVQVIASADGYGLGWRTLKPDADAPEVDIRLRPEQLIHGRLVDLQGQPAPGVEVGVVHVAIRDQDEYGGVGFWNYPSDELPPWPAPTTTDGRGRFTLRGIGRGQGVELQVRDDRFALQKIRIAPDVAERPEGVTFSLTPAHIIEGQVTYEDTGAPVPHARLDVMGGPWMSGQADEYGRFRLNPYAQSPHSRKTPGGQLFHVHALAPNGEPYLGIWIELDWPQGASRQHVNLALPRGILVHGTITEDASGEPIAGARVQYLPQYSNNPDLREDLLFGEFTAVLSGSDGTFTIAVPPGPGHLLIHGPSTNYVLSEIGSNTLYHGQPGGPRKYAQAVIPLDIKAGEESHRVNVQIHRGVTLKGHVLDPDGQPVAEAELISRFNVSPNSQRWLGVRIPVHDGHFEMPGCDPEEIYRVLIIDSHNQWGTAVELTAEHQGGEPATIRLVPCGSASVRFMTADGTPLVNYSPELQVVVTPGPFQWESDGNLKHETLAADAGEAFYTHKSLYPNGSSTDPEGRLTFAGLIPGATYRIVSTRDGNISIGSRALKDFQVESSQTLELPDITIDEPR